MVQRKCCCCVACLDNNYPAQITASFAGVAASSFPCVDCLSFNGDWVLSKSSDCTIGLTSGVYTSAVNYYGAFPAVNACTCGVNQGTLNVAIQVWWNYGGVPGTRRVSAVIGNSFGCLSVLFILTQTGQTAPFDCASFSSLSIPFDSAGLYCDAAGATCSLSV